MGKEVLTWERERETWKIRKATWEGWEKLSWERGKATLGIGYWSELKKKKKSKWSVLNKRKGTHWGDQQQDCLLERVNKKKHKYSTHLWKKASHPEHWRPQTDAGKFTCID